MLISVVNHTGGTLSDEKVQEGIRAINRQIAHDFKPHWHVEAELRLEGSIGKKPDEKRLPELRGDAIIYLWNGVNVDDALGFHEANAAGVPFGFLRSDPAGRLTKHFPLPGLPLPGAGHACPLWAIYGAFRTPEAMVRQVVQFADGSRYLFVARAQARRRPRAPERRRPSPSGAWHTRWKASRARRRAGSQGRAR